MAKYEIDDRAAPPDSRNVVVQGKRYHYQTTTECTTCSVNDRNMFVKAILNGGYDSVIECPACDTCITVKTASTKRLE